MALPFFDPASKKRPDRMLAVDLGSRITKAVQMQHRGDGYALNGFAILDAPIFDKALSPEMLADHLKAVAQALDARGKAVTLAVGVNDAIVRHVEMPQMPVDDMRMVLKLNTRNYLQQDLTNYLFDCQPLLGTAPAGAGPTAQGAGAGPKQKVLVAGAKKQLVEDYTQGARGAGLAAEHIVPGLIGPVNAFELALPEVFAGEVVALVDIGFRNSSICILEQGQLTLSRVVNLGSDRLTQAITETLNVSYAEAEGIKVGMPEEVRPAVESVIMPLGRELRASIDFFEHQQDRPVSQVFLTGGAARSELIVQTLQSELVSECKTWNPTSWLQMELPPQQAAEIEQVAPQLAVAVGAALAAF